MPFVFPERVGYRRGWEGGQKGGGGVGPEKGHPRIQKGTRQVGTGPEVSTHKREGEKTTIS